MPVQATAAPQPAVREQPPYQGTARTFSLQGSTFTVSPEMDVFNHYRLEFRRLARLQSGKLRRDYYARIRDLDAFLTRFPAMYCQHRQPLLDYAAGIFLRYGLYDIWVKQFEDQHNTDFCLCGEDVNVMIDSFNKTIEANRQAKAGGYNMIPGVTLGGGGVGMTSIAEADVRNADVSPRQRAELFGRINTGMLMERAYLDYWRVFLSMTWWMNRRGIGVWYPTEEGNRRAEEIYQTICSGRIPPEKLSEQAVSMLQLNPYADEYLQFISRQYGKTPETAAIFAYFGYEG